MYKIKIELKKQLITHVFREPFPVTQVRGNVIRSSFQSGLVPHFRFSVPVQLRQHVAVQTEQHLRID